MKIDDLDLSVHAYNCLYRAKIETVEQLKELSDDDLFRIRGLTTRGYEEIRKKLAEIPITNADRIRAMNDEELAVFLATIQADLYKYDSSAGMFTGTDVNENYNWLQQPAKEEVSI